MAEVNPKNVLSKRRDQKNEEDDSHSSKNRKYLSIKILAPKGPNLTKKNKRKRSCTSFSLEPCSPPRQRKKRIKKQGKKRQR